MQWNGKPDREYSQKFIERKYTPISGDEKLGSFKLLVKIYRPNSKFEHGGKMSRYIDYITPGTYVDIQGPYGMNEYLGHGKFLIRRKERQFNKLGMICGGSGITPMFRIIQTILNDPTDPTEIWLLYANNTKNDILLFNELEQMKQDKRLHVHYTVVVPDEIWDYSTGFVDKDMIENHLPKADEETAILLCGPPPMLEYACYPNLTNHDKSNIIDF